MSETDARAAERSFHDDSDYGDVDLERADDVQVRRGREPRSTFALRLDGSTIDQLREVADRQGARPTQLARQWLVERLDREQAKGTGGSPLEERVSDLERRVDRIAGVSSSAASDAGPIVELEAQASVARWLVERLAGRASVEVPADAGADLVVRSGGQTWVIEFKSADVDLTPSLGHLSSLADRLAAHPVLVAPRLGRQRAHALSGASGVLVTGTDGLDDLLAEIAPAGGALGR